MSNTKIGAGKVVAEAAVMDDGEAARMQGADSGAALVRAGASVVAMGQLGGCGGFNLKPCFLDIAYSVSPWNENDMFSNGSFVLDRKEQIAKQTEQLTVALLTGYRYWMTYPEKGMTRSQYQFWPSEAEARKAGRVTQRPPRGGQGPKRDAIEACDLTMLVRQPEGSTSAKFALRLGEYWYAPVRFSVNKLWEDIRPIVDLARARDAGLRRVSVDQGSLSRFFMRMWTSSKKLDNGNTLVLLNMSMAPGKNGPEEVPPEVLSDMVKLSGEIAAAKVATDDEPPSILES